MENNKGVTGVSVEEYKKQLIKALDSDDIRVFTEDVSVMLGYTEDNSNFKTRLGFVDIGKMLLGILQQTDRCLSGSILVITTAY